ncbi:hypothetical protein FRC10_011394 [Ceratobasidium sp. 414]|nr:hypothetical protein FRC10_011394 [Ceratobasidium sp. 414]
MHTSNTLKQEPDATQSGIEPADAPEEMQSASVPKHSKRMSKPTERISTHSTPVGYELTRLTTVEQQAKRHAQKKKKKRIESPNLSDTDFTGDDDDDNDANNDANNDTNNLWEDDDLNESAAGLDGGYAVAENEEYEPEILALEDTDISIPDMCSDINAPDTHSDCNLLLKRLQEATDKDFSSYSTKELRDFWKAFCDDQEAIDEVEVWYPQVRLSALLTLYNTNMKLQITQVAAFEIAPQVLSNPSPAIAKQPEQAKHTLAESVDVVSKHACLSVDANANPSLIDPPSPNPQSIAPPTFPAHPVQTTQSTHTPRQAQPAGPPTALANRALLRVQNAPSWSLGPSGSLLPSTAPLVSFPMATTVLDKPACLPVPPCMAKPVPRVPTPIPLWVPTAAPPRAPPRAPAAVAAPAHAPARAPAHAPAHTPAAVVAPSRAPAPMAAPSHARVLSSAPVAAQSRAPVAVPSRAAASVALPCAPPRASLPTGSHLLSVPEVEPDWSVDLGGPAPGVPAQVRPYIPYTDLLEDHAKEIAEAEARQVGKRVVRYTLTHNGVSKTRIFH